MSTTTIRLEDDLKERIAQAAERTGRSAHAFIVDAIARSVEQAELDQEFHEIADRRWAKILKSGETVGWEEAKTYLKARARGEQVKKPVARKVGA